MLENCLNQRTTMTYIQALILICVLNFGKVNAQEQSGHLTSSNGSMDQYFVEESSPHVEQSDINTETANVDNPTTLNKPATEETLETNNLVEEIPAETKGQIFESSINTVITDTTSKISTATSTSVTTTCGKVWDQCGGADYHGPNCCQPGLACAVVNDYWARCIPASTTLLSSSSARGSLSSSSSYNNAIVLKSPNHNHVMPWAAVVAMLL